MTQVSISPFAGVGAQLFDNNGVILSGGKIYTYAAGTTTPLATYTSVTGATPHTNPIILDSAGRVPGGEIWIEDGKSYKFVVKTAVGVLIGTYDNVNEIAPGFITVANHVGDGATTVFGVGNTPTTKLATDVYINGVYQDKNTYTVSGSNLTFTQAPPLNSQIEIVTQQTTVLGTTSADLVSYTASGAGAITQTVADKLDQTISVKDFGAVGDGVTDDTVAIQAAIDAAFAAGGANVDCTGGRWLIDSADLIVKKGVTLIGPYYNFGEPDNQDYSTSQSVFIVNSAFTIRLAEEFSGIRGLGVFRKGLTTPNSAAAALAEIASFAGKAITVGYGVSKDASDTYVGYCLILGFQYAYYCDFNERPRVEYVAGDCTNGIYMKRVYDMDHLHKCHFWPFVTAHKAWSLTLDIWRRTGVAYNFDVDVDWGQATNCFSYGYDTGFRVNSCDNVVLLNCGADNFKNNNNYSSGFHILGDSQNVNLIGCKSASQNKGILIAQTGTFAQTVKVVGGNIWGLSTGTGRGIDVQTGGAVVSGVSFFDGPTCVFAGASAGLVSVDACSFSAVSTPFSFANLTAVQVGPNNVFLDTVVDTTTGRRFTTDGVARSNEIAYSATQSIGVNANRARGTRSAPAAIQDTDSMYAVSARGWDGSAFIEAAAMRSQVQGAPSAGNVSGNFIWSTRNGAGAFGDRVVLSRDGSFYPAVNNTHNLGIASLIWSQIWGSDLHLFPISSINPVTNGEMVFQLTSNTQLEIKVRGSDGVVRSASLTLT